MDKRRYMALMAFFVVLISCASPVAAVKVVDHGTHYFYLDDTPMKIVWKTYQYNNNFMKTYATVYTKLTGKYRYAWSERITIAKVTKTTVKVREWTNSDFVPPSRTYYAKTKLTAARYYWRIYRPTNIIIG